MVESEQTDLLKKLHAYFAQRNMHPLDFQIDALCAWERHESGLIIAPTGFGKTLAAIIPTLLTMPQEASGLTVLWITPLRALAIDTTSAIQQAADVLQPQWRVEARTGDTKNSQKAKQDKRMPQVLITTPESLSIMLSRADTMERFSKLALVVVDEWHALLETKRGIQTELCLARLRKLCPSLKLWGLSATLHDPDHALDVLLGNANQPNTIIFGPPAKQITLETVLPEKAERFPWGGHLGLKQLHAVANYIDKAASTLVFTNTRSQTELWYQALLDLKPEWAGLIALHHGSLDIESRRWVEESIRDNHLKAVICTATLDLGVDFSPVEQVIQIGSAKGISRLRQRAGRSGHRPDAASKILIAPTHAFEIVESLAARRLLGQRDLKSHVPATRFKEEVFPAIDVLIQHLVTISLGTGFTTEEMWIEVTGTYTYRNLTLAHWAWTLAFITDGGVLHAYPEYRKVIKDENNIYRIANSTIARRHRHQIGTIVADATLNVQWASGGRLGHIEESFISRLKPGNVFLFGGRKLELVRIREMTAYVRLSKSPDATVAKWMGSTMPLSTELAEATRMVISEANSETIKYEPEWKVLQPLFRLQKKWSHIPREDETLVELIKTREGWHLFLYTFAGRTVNLALASLWAWRLAQRQPSTISIAVSDYGLELVSPVPQPYDVALGLVPTEQNIESGYLLLEADRLPSLEAELNMCINETELSKRRFREIARISGLIYQGYPGEGRSAKHLQTSSGLLFEIFHKHDPDNLLLKQAHAEAFKQELDISRLRETLANLRNRKCILQRPSYPTPFAFPLYVESLRERLSNEELADRVRRLVERLERSADNNKEPQKVT